MTASVRLGAGLRLRHATDDDRPFLRHLYETARQEELAGLSWTEEGRRAFLDHQLSVQELAYRKAHPDARFFVVEMEGAPVGRLSIAEAADVVHVIDIALLPEYRGAGAGEQLLRWVIAKARRVTLSVGRWNRAQRLYSDLGFVVVGEDEMYVHMERPALS